MIPLSSPPPSARSAHSFLQRFYYHRQRAQRTHSFNGSTTAPPPSAHSAHSFLQRFYYQIIDIGGTMAAITRRHCQTQRSESLSLFESPRRRRYGNPINADGICSTRTPIVRL